MFCKSSFILHWLFLLISILKFANSLNYHLNYEHENYDHTPVYEYDECQTTSPAIDQLFIWASNHTPQERVTTGAGIPVPSLTASQTIGPYGNLVFTEIFLPLAAFVRERIPERNVNGKGAGAHGTFTLTNDISQYTKAKFLNGIGKKTEVFVRFSISHGESGSSDSAVDTLGFATKFYTEEGNHDLIANNIEPFPIRDPMLFSDLSHSRKRNPSTNLKDRNMWWDFVSLRPETTLSVLHLFSDYGRPSSYRRINGYGGHAFKLVNSQDEIVFGKFVWKSNQPAKALTHLEAYELAGDSPDYFVQDLYDSIACGEYPSWDLYIQLMTEEETLNYGRNAFDVTKTWRVEDFHLIPVGTMILDRNPADYFTEVEQVSFAASNMVIGIGPGPDKVLEGRLFAYQDASRYRLGLNGGMLPINRPVSQVTTYNRDGFDNSGKNGGGGPNFFPNSFGGPKPDVMGAKQVPFFVKGRVDRYDVRDQDEFVEAREFLEMDVKSGNRRRMIAAIADWLKDAMPEIRERVYRNNFYPISRLFGSEVRAATEKAVLEATKNLGV